MEGEVRGRATVSSVVSRDCKVSPCVLSTENVHGARRIHVLGDGHLYESMILPKLGYFGWK